MSLDILTDHLAFIYYALALCLMLSTPLRRGVRAACRAIVRAGSERATD